MYVCTIYVVHCTCTFVQCSFSLCRSGCYLGVYGALGLLQSVFILLGAFSLAIAAIFASRRLHNSMLTNILRSPMSFFDTTPLGRILNRFSKDTYVIDEIIPRSLRSFIFTFLTVIATLIVIIVTTPPFLIIILPLLIFYGVVQVSSKFCHCQKFELTPIKYLYFLACTIF